MRIARAYGTPLDHHDAPGAPTGYTLWLSASDTEAWARKPGAAWPCSTLRGHSVRVDVDANGLYACTLGGKNADADGNELDACVADHLPADCRHLWPCWEA